MTSTNTTIADSHLSQSDKSHPVVKLYKNLQKVPGGRFIFSKLICFRAPYFGSIKPVFYRVAPGHLETGLKKHRAVTNHIGSVHALAMGKLKI